MVVSTFPPLDVTTVKTIIPSYLYQQYTDDDDLLALIGAYNEIAQAYLDWMNALNLPVYTGDPIFGALLDWVGQGLYGIARPVLPSGQIQAIGPYNTLQFNQHLTFNGFTRTGPSTYFATSDDVYKRVMTWLLYKGDGKQFNIRWLKRRVMRFLFGVNGTDFNVDQTYRVSVTFGTAPQVNINILAGIATVLGSAVNNNNFSQFNTTVFNNFKSSFTPFPPIAMAPIFKAAVDGGILELPFQFTYNVTF